MENTLVHTSSPLSCRLRYALSPAFGVATLCMIYLLGALVSPNHLMVYHRPGAPSALIVPALFNLLLLTLVLTALLGVPRQGTRLSIALWTGVAASMPWVIITNLCLLYGWYAPYALGLCLFAVGLVSVVLAAVLYRPRPATAYAGLYRSVSLPLKLAALLGCILFAQVVWFGLKASFANDALIPLPPVVAHANRPRIFWIVMDELSYDQVFPSRAAGLSLPNLDAFAAQSTLFTHAVPVGIYTDVVLPSLMTGLPADSIRSSADAHHLYLHIASKTSAPPRWQLFDPAQTVFADAKAHGYRTAVAGWFNPYCRILPGVLNSCFWVNQTNITPMFPAQTIRQNLFYPIRLLLGQLRSALLDHQLHLVAPEFYAQMHIDDYNQLYRAADQIVADPSFDFVLLHLPIPHPKGIYDRRLRTLSTNTASNYLDNLALTDTYLAHLRGQLEQLHEWDDATVLIMGDHSWRTTMLWKDDPHWTTEEQRASSGGTFDNRPFYALKLPHQQTAATVDAPFPAIRTRALLDTLLDHPLLTSAQFQDWAVASTEAARTNADSTQAP